MYTVVIEFDPNNGSYGATSPDFGTDVIAIGKSEGEALDRFRNALEGHIAFLRDQGDAVPAPRHTVATIDLNI